MTTLSKDEILAWAHEAKVPTVVTNEVVIAFATLCRADLVAIIKNLQADLTKYGNIAYGIEKERDALRIALSHYANEANWDDDFHGTKRKWLEPDSSTRNKYAGFAIAQAAMKRGEA